MTGRAAVLAVVVGTLIVSYAYPLRTWFDQQSRLNDLRAEQAALQNEVTALEERQERLRDPAHIKAQARERLNFVMPGEVGFIVTGPDEREGEPAEGPTTASTGGPGPWWERLWASVEAADAASDGIGPGID